MIPWVEIIKQVIATGMAIAQAAPGPIENRMRKQLKADEKRLAGGGGGYAEGARQAQMAGVANTVQAQQQQALAQLARGSSAGGGESGMAAMRQAGVLTGSQMAMQRGASDVRAADLAYRDSQMQQLLQRQMALAAMGKARKDAAIKTKSDAVIGQNGTGMGDITGQGMAMGGVQRGTDAANVSDLTAQGGTV